MQWASRVGPLVYPIVKQTLSGAMQWDAQITPEEKASARACYEAAARLFDSRKGGSLQVFGNRPLAEEIRAYFVHTFQYLPHLRKIYWDRVVMLRREQQVANLTEKRLQLFQDRLSLVNKPGDNQYLSLQVSQISPTSKTHYRPPRLVRRFLVNAGRPSTLWKVISRK